MNYGFHKCLFDKFNYFHWHLIIPTKFFLGLKKLISSRSSIRGHLKFRIWLSTSSSWVGCIFTYISTVIQFPVIIVSFSLYFWLYLSDLSEDSVPSLLKRLDPVLSAQVTLAAQLNVLEALRELPTEGGNQFLEVQYRHILDNQTQLSDQYNSHPGYLNRVTGRTRVRKPDTFPHTIHDTYVDGWADHLSLPYSP